MSTFYNASSVGAGDVQNDYRARLTLRDITAQFAAFGLIQTADPGQITTTILNAACGWIDQPLTTTPWAPPGVTGSMNNLFDANTATSVSVALTPSIAAPVGFNYDSGVGITNTAATYKVYFANTTTDLKTWVLQGSSDLTNWTNLDTQTNVVPGSAGYQTFTIATPGAYRYYRLYVTAVNGGAATTLFEWQLITAGSTVFTSGLQNLMTGSTVTSNLNFGFQIWRFNDTLQATAPFFFKIEYANSTGFLQVTITVGNSTNGAGTITGAGVLPRVTINSTNAVAGQGRCAYSGGSGSHFTLACGFFGTNIASFILSMERTKDSSGVDTGVGVCFYSAVFTGGSTTQISQGVCRCDGNPSITPETLTGIMNTSGTTTMIRAGVVGVGECVCFIGQRQNAMVGLIGYKILDMTALVPFTATVNGSLHTYLPLGVGKTEYARSGSSSDALAILWE
jgi:hypothetical protein